MKIIKALSIAVFLALPSAILAQGDRSYNNLPGDEIAENLITAEIPMDTSIVRDFENISNFYQNLDSLGHSWFVQQANAMRFSQEDYWDPADSAWRNPGPSYPDSIYINRLANIESIIDLTYNEQVKAYINVYTQKKREKLSVLLGLADYYFPIFEQILLEYDLPVELKYLAIIESALNPNATSRMGATGLWQFMYGTGKIYKLEINSDVDQRRDPIQSTYAAATYLKDLYAMFGDWTLALAAYNCGPGNVRKAIARSGGKTNFWDIYYKLPKETRGYVPAFIGATYAMHFYKDHGIYPTKIDMSLAVDTLHINREIHFGQIAEVLQIPIELIQTLNPQYKRDIIPAKLKSYALVLPVENIVPFIHMEDSIFNHKRNEFFDPSKRHLKPTEMTAHGEVPANSTKIIYKIKNGDNLGAIAARHGVKVSDLKRWNRIGKNNFIKAGNKLVIYVPDKG